MIRAERRRLSMISQIPLIERPDCIRIDFNTTSDNYTFKFGRFQTVSLILLDGVTPTYTATGFGECTFVVPTAGSHTVYIKPGADWDKTNYTFGYFACEYIRFPYNANSIKNAISPGSSTNTWKKIDILCPNYMYLIKSNQYQVFNRCTIIRVPIGVKQVYENNGVSSAILNKMVEYNFRYDV